MLDIKIFDGCLADACGFVAYNEVNPKDFDLKKIETYIKSKAFHVLIDYLGDNTIPVIEHELDYLEEMLLDQANMDLIKKQMERIKDAYLCEKDDERLEEIIIDYLHKNGPSSRLEIDYGLNTNRNKTKQLLRELMDEYQVSVNQDKYIAK